MGSRLSAEEIELPQKTLIFSPEKVLEDFFRELFEETTAGYVLYGKKPVDLEGFRDRERTFPGSPERRSSVLGSLGLKYWHEIAPDFKNQKYILFDSLSPEGNEIVFINREAFNKVITENSLLFEHKFGVGIAPDDLLDELVLGGFSSVFKEKTALQGIVLGYGTENSISYEYGSSFVKHLNLKNSPPNQSPLPSKNPEEVRKKISAKQWGKAELAIQDLTCYKASNQADRLKIPFSYVKSSEKSKKLLSEYRKYQNNVEKVLNKKKFLTAVLQRLGTKIPPPFTQTVTSKSLEDFFSDAEKKIIPRLIAQTLLNTFPDEISSSFFQGMEAAQNKTQNAFEFSETEFLDILWKADRSAIKPTVEFLKCMESQENTVCLIPHKLFIRTLKKSGSQKILTKEHNSIRVRFLLKDLKDHPLVGTYQLEEYSELYLDKLIPGLAHGLLGMKEGEIREVYMHPDFMYGRFSDFGKGQAVKATVELIYLEDPIGNTNFPLLKPIDVIHLAPPISSQSEFVDFQKKHAYFCGVRSWEYYQKAFPLVDLPSVVEEIKNSKMKPLSSYENELLLKLEWLLQQI